MQSNIKWNKKKRKCQKSKIPSVTTCTTLKYARLYTGSYIAHKSESDRNLHLNTLPSALTTVPSVSSEWWGSKGVQEASGKGTCVHVLYPQRMVAPHSILVEPEVAPRLSSLSLSASELHAETTNINTKAKVRKHSILHSYMCRNLKLQKSDMPKYSWVLGS